MLPVTRVSLLVSRALLLSNKGISTKNKKLLVTRAWLLEAKGITTRNKKLLETRLQEAILVIRTLLLVTRASLLGTRSY